MKLEKVIRELYGRNVRFEDSAKGKIARAEIKAIDRELRPIVAIIPKFVAVLKKQNAFNKKYSRYLNEGYVNIPKLIAMLQDFEAENRYSHEVGLDDSGWFEDLE